MMNFKKELMVVECVNISAWYRKVRENDSKLKGLSVKTLWALKKNMKKIDDIAANFEEFRNSLEDKLKADYFNDEKSEPAKFLDNDGKEVEGLKVKEEYLEDYQKELNSLNGEINGLLMSKEEVVLNAIDIESEIENMDSTDITMEDLDMLSIFEKTEDEEEA